MVGRILQLEARGVTSVDSRIAKPMTEDTTFYTASCTKLITTIAALQCVERGQLSLDQDITFILQEWKNPDVLIGFNETGQPTLKRAQNTITLRQLLTHSWGNAYDFADPRIKKHREINKQNDESARGEVVSRLNP